jgi:AraC family transcriptional regulator
MNIEAGFGGRVLAARAANGFHLSETRYEASTSMAAHAHGDPYFCFVRRGSFRETTQRRSVEHSAGSIVFHSAGDEHSDRFLQSGARCFNVSFPASLVTGHSTPFDGISNARRLTLTLSALYREFSSADASPLVLEGLIYQTLGEAFERMPKRLGRRAAWLERVREEIDDRLDENLALGGLAASVDVHPVHLARAFRARFGMKITAYILERRLRRVKALLTGTSSPLAEVASSAGFADQSHLCRVFKHHTGVTPGQFRRDDGVRSP